MHLVIQGYVCLTVCLPTLAGADPEQPGAVAEPAVAMRQRGYGSPDRVPGNNTSNHYVLVVDASGSMQEYPAKATVFRKALDVDVAQRLYRGGFSEHVPAFRPKQDQLSLFHFGVIPSGQRGPVRELLKHYDLSRQYLHPLLHRSRNVHLAALRHLLPPTEAYQWSIVAWSQELPIWMSSPQTATTPTQRTFLVWISDGKYNESDPRGEIDFTRRSTQGSTTSRYETVSQLVQLVRQQHVKTDGNGSAGRAAWTRNVPAGRTNDAIYVEVYEVVPTRWLRWENDPSRLSPFQGVHARWTQQLTDRPRLVVTADLEPGFVRWAEAGGVTKVELRATCGPAVGSAIGPLRTPLQLNLDLPGGVPGETRAGSLSANLRGRQTDAVLGAREVGYTTAEQSFSLPPLVPLQLAVYCIGAAFALATALVSASWAWRNRYAKGHLGVTLPGIGGTVVLGRKGELRLSSSLPRYAGQPLLTVHLPPLWFQNLFYRGARLSVRARCGRVAWGDPAEGLTELVLPHPHHSVTARWTEALGPRDAVWLNVDQGPSHATARLELAVPVTVPEELQMNEIEYFVGLDLGSETIAAYCEWVGKGSGPRQMIELQAHAKKLMLDSTLDPLCLLDTTRSGPPRRSCRLRTRFELRQYVQPKCLPDSHARLDLFTPSDAHQQCLFIYFAADGHSFIGVEMLLPNPKLMFQAGSTDVFPKVRAKTPSGNSGTDEYVELEPLQVIQHLTTQVVRNFVLQSPELQGGDPCKVHLTVTVPNVYSPVHLEPLKRFLEQHTGVREVDTVYEADAIAHYVMRPFAGGDNVEFHTALSAKPIKRIVTIDVGRGTTDLSHIEFHPSDIKGGYQEAEILARTGKTDGGNALSYIFAEYYDAQLRRAFRMYGAMIAAEKPPFGFCNLRSGDKSVNQIQALALNDLEKLIDAVKPTITERYEVQLPEDEQRKWIRKIGENILQSIDPNWNQTTAVSGNPQSVPYMDFLRVLEDALVLPRRLPGPSVMVLPTFLARFLARHFPATDQESRTILVTLRRRIEVYV